MPEPTTTDITASDHSKPVRLAHAILTAAVEQRWPRVQRLLERLNAECTAAGLGDALVAWCDALLEHGWGGPAPLGIRGRVGHLNVDTGTLDQPDEITPERAWTSRLVAARAAGDLEAFRAALAELNAIDDGFARGTYALVLLNGVATSMRVLPYGHARLAVTDA